MDRTNQLEKHLLSRVFGADQARAAELLAARYSMSGDQKPVLPLVRTETTAPVKLVLHVEKTSTGVPTTPHAVKHYFAHTKLQQRKAERYMRKHKLADPGAVAERFGVPQLQAFLGLHALWNGYIHDLLQLENPKARQNPAGLMQKLAAADFHGCRVKVSHATTPLYVGLEGIVVYDTMHTLVLVVEGGLGGFKYVNKRGSVFEVCVELMVFSLVGSRMEYRAVDRAGRKFKWHGVDGMY